MSEAFTNSIVTVLMAIIALATLAVLVSKNADTSNVIGAGGNAVGGLIKTAISPITGGSSLSSLSIPGFSSGAGYAQ